ncbi:MAG: fibronectin type III domain-containing protein [Spirochaetaceae bacterium]|nr:fibronectin type III domain-containing protein [Spirochaetaceae bacterium]
MCRRSWHRVPPPHCRSYTSRVVVLLAIGGVLLGACGGLRPTGQAPDDAPAPTLSAGAAASDSVTVSWTAPDTAFVLRGYELGWRRAAEASWTEVRDIPSTQTAYTITGLDADTAYEVRVRAVYAGGEGKWSPVIAVETTEPVPVLSAGTRTASSVTVSWTAPETDLDLRGYELGWRRAAATNWTEVRDIPSTQTAYTITGLDADTAYEVRVRAVYAGGEGKWSPVIAVETTEPVPVLSAGTRTASSVTVSWTAPETDLDLRGYELGWRRAAATDWTEVRDIPSTQTTYTITDLEADTAYEIRVRAVYAGEDGEWSPEVAVQTTPISGSGTPAPRPAPRTPPIFQIASVSPRTITLSLTAADPAITGYEVSWKRVLTDDQLATAAVPATATTYTITGVRWLTRYAVGVRTVTGDDAGEWFYARAFTRGGYDPKYGPRISVYTDDAIADEGDGSVEFMLVTTDAVSEALTVYVYTFETERMLRDEFETYVVNVGASSAGRKEVRFRVALQVDTVDERDSIVYASVGRATGYDRGGAYGAGVRVRDDD